MPLSVVVVLQGFDEAGAVASCCRNQMLALAGRHQVSLITDRSRSPQRDADLAPRVGIERLAVPSLSWMHRFAHVPRQILFILLAGRALRRRLRRQPVDLVLFHSHPPTALLAPLLRRHGCRTAMVMHGDIFDRPAGTYDRRITWWYRVTTQRAYRSCDGVLALSPYMAAFAERGGARAQRIHLVPNGVDAEEIGLADGSHVDPPSPASLLFVGRIEFNKGVDLLIDAFCSLLERWPSLQLTCIGSPERDYLNSLLTWLKRGGVSVSTPAADSATAQVRFLPPQPRQQLGAHYLRAAVVVVPSRSETQSTVLMEAMAAGRAVVASDTGGNPMLVDDGRSGRLFACGEAGSLSRALAELLADPERIQAMGRSARERHRQHYSRSRSAAALLAAVQALTEAQR